MHGRMTLIATSCGLIKLSKIKRLFWKSKKPFLSHSSSKLDWEYYLLLSKQHHHNLKTKHSSQRFEIFSLSETIRSPKQFHMTSKANHSQSHFIFTIKPTKLGLSPWQSGSIWAYLSNWHNICYWIVRWTEKRF